MELLTAVSVDYLEGRDHGWENFQAFFEQHMRSAI